MNYPKLQGTERNTQVLLEDYEIMGVVIPKGYETNGQDSPRWSWSLGFPPFKPMYSPAYVVHDYLISKAYENNSFMESVKAANKTWADIMLEVDPSKQVKVAIWCLNKYWSLRFLIGG